MSDGLRFHVLRILQIAHKDGLSVDEVSRRIGVPPISIQVALAHLENQGLVISALVDDNSPNPRRLFHLSRQARRSLQASP